MKIIIVSYLVYLLLQTTVCSSLGCAVKAVTVFRTSQRGEAPDPLYEETATFMDMTVAKSKMIV